MLTSDNRVICPPLLYETLSELLHGRGAADALSWDAVGLLERDPFGPGMVNAVEAIADTITLTLREVRDAARRLATEQGNSLASAWLRHEIDAFSRPEDTLDGNAAATANLAQEGPRRFDVEQGKLRQRPRRWPDPDGLASPPLQTLMPLTPREGLAPQIAGDVEHLAGIFMATAAGERPAGRLWRDDEFTMYAFAWHRARSVRAAHRAMRQESLLMGPEFDPERLSSKSTRWTLLSELTSLLGTWHRHPSYAQASLLTGSAIRSAYWLWLEDDDRAMAVLRCVLEQCARMRTWRTKPNRAQVLEGREQTMPRDWLEEAGWRRLGPLNRALGEYAHAKVTSRWTGARELLSSLQLDVDGDNAIYTARGAALDLVSSLVAHEVHAAVVDMSSVLAATVCELFADFGLDPKSNSLEAQIDHVYRQRVQDLGTSDFVAARSGDVTGPMMSSANIERIIERMRASRAGDAG